MNLKTALGRCRTRVKGQAGITMIEVIVTVVIMGMVVGSLASLVGAAARSKLIASSRSLDTVTARQTLEWMSERMRNAGLNILPSAQIQARCQDMVVAQDPSLRPQADRVYVSGEIINTDTVAGNEVVTIGYRLNGGVVVEEAGSCAGGWAPTTASVSDSRVTVTDLSFRYFDRPGDEVIVPTSDITAIRSIRLIQISLTVQSVQGRSGIQVQTFTRQIMLRNPRPDNNNWLSPVETTP